MKTLILFFKAVKPHSAHQGGLFGVTSQVSGYVNPKGTFVAPYQGTRHHALKKPKHPLSGHLFTASGEPASPVQTESVSHNKKNLIVAAQDLFGVQHDREGTGRKDTDQAPEFAL